LFRMVLGQCFFRRADRAFRRRPAIEARFSRYIYRFRPWDIGTLAWSLSERVKPGLASDHQIWDEDPIAGVVDKNDVKTTRPTTLKAQSPTAREGPSTLDMHAKALSCTWQVIRVRSKTEH